MIKDVLEGLVGRTVELRSQAHGDYRDDGVLHAYDDRWIVLKKGENELLYFPIVNVRLLKPLK